MRHDIHPVTFYGKQFVWNIFEGRAEGRAEGRDASNIQHIQHMRSKGFDDEMIADLLELDVEYVKQH